MEEASGQEISGFESKIHFFKTLKVSTNTTTQLRKWTRGLNRHFTKESTQMTISYIHKKMLNIISYQRNVNFK